jgi:hypothetical protein
LFFGVVGFGNKLGVALAAPTGLSGSRASRNAHVPWKQGRPAEMAGTVRTAEPDAVQPFTGLHLSRLCRAAPLDAARSEPSLALVGVATTVVSSVGLLEPGLVSCYPN